jgi:excisionase family DNA binding protein
MADYLSVDEVAQRCGVSPTTVHRWLQSGRLTAIKRGRFVQIPADQLTPIIDHGEHANRATAAGGQRTAPIEDNGASDDRGYARLVELVAELTLKAEAAAMWQARAEFLAGELASARDEIRALQAPAPAPPEPWWRRWFKS